MDLLSAGGGPTSQFGVAAWLVIDLDLDGIFEQPGPQAGFKRPGKTPCRRAVCTHIWLCRV